MKTRRGRGRPKGATPGATRARILRAARAAFARGGYVGTTNADIAAQAGVTAAALYQYFDAKTALYMAVVQDAQAELLARYREAIADAGSTRAALEALLVASGELHEGNPSLAAFLSAVPVEIKRHPEVAAAMAAQPSEVAALVVEVVDAGVRAGEVPRGGADALVAMFLACSMGLSLYAAAIDGDALPGAIAAFVAMMEGSLFRSARARSSTARARSTSSSRRRT